MLMDQEASSPCGIRERQPARSSAAVPRISNEGQCLPAAAVLFLGFVSASHWPVTVALRLDQ